MRFMRKRLKKWNVSLLNSPWGVILPSSYRCREKWTYENSFERRWIITIIVIITPRWKTVDTRERENRAKMITVPSFIWMITRSRNRSEIGSEGRCDSLYSRDDRERADSRRNSRETATIGLTIVDRRRHRPRRHSRRYYVDRNKRWVACDVANRSDLDMVRIVSCREWLIEGTRGTSFTDNRKIKMRNADTTWLKNIYCYILRIKNCY